MNSVFRTIDLLCLLVGFSKFSNKKCKWNLYTLRKLRQIFLSINYRKSAPFEIVFFFYLLFKV
jgi:hypothetical protein